MPRTKMVRSTAFPYHVSARCINRDWFSLPMPRVWQIMSEHLAFVARAYEVEVLSFVLMSNHFHLLIRTPRGNLAETMAWFMREASRALVRAGNRVNGTWGSPHFRSLIASPNYFLSAYKYVYHNPIAAGICDNILDYEFSTLPGLLGRQSLIIPVVEDLTLFEDVEGTLDWLNVRPRSEYWEAIRIALKHRTFKLPKIDSRPHPLEVEHL